MDLSKLIRDQVAHAAKLVDSLMVTVRHEVVISRDKYAKASYAAPVNRKAVLTIGNKKVVDKTGAELQSRSQLLFLESVTINLGDRLTLPDGTQPPIMDVKYPPTDSSGQTFAAEVFLGYSAR